LGLASNFDGTGTTTIASGKEAVKTIRREIDARRLDLNEADTRFHLIDRILIECLGWPKSAFRLAVC
jgi:hypothetical protein